MPQSDPLAILLAHDHWATQQILETCAKLTPEQFHQRFDMGPGSLHNTTTHIIGAMRTWTRLMAGQEVGVRLEDDGQQRTAQELITLSDAVNAAFSAEGRRLPLDAIVTRTRDGKTFQFTRGAVLVHVSTHGMHHRAQCLNMLRHLGVKSLPPSGVAEWTWIADGKK